jgi:fumarate hydratase, class II
MRTEIDTFGTIDVPDYRYYGAQTARALLHFRLGSEPMPIEIIHALAIVKKAAAMTNAQLGVLERNIAELIISAAEEIIDGRLDAHFPLHVWQSGSGTQTHMNVNEVISNRAIALAGGKLGSKKPVHPNDHVNRSQSTNDVFPTAMHIAVVLKCESTLLPTIASLHDALAEKARAFTKVIKIGRTHLQDATPMTLGQEIGAWVTQINAATDSIRAALTPMRELALGATAVGTGLNTPPGYADLAVAKINEITGEHFVPAADKFAALASHDAFLRLSGALKQLAAAMMKLANDIRWLASGPRCGLGELLIPDNEPGSSIMPAKVNPTQCEALAMVCCQVYGNDASIGMAASHGNLQLNTFKPLFAYNLLQSIQLLADAAASFTKYCAVGIEPNPVVIDRHLRESLMLVTALTPRLGYDRAAQLAQHAHKTGLTLREAAIQLELMTAEEFDGVVRPEEMIGTEVT